MTNQAARFANIILGIWLFISAFIWPHSMSQFNNAWVVGLLAVVFAGAGFVAPAARYLNAALGVWLFLSIWALPAINAGTLWNSGIVAVLMFVAALTGPVQRRERAFRRPA